MSRTGNCYDNAPLESFFHTLKVELVHQCRCATQAEARQALLGYIEGYYNRHRMHSAIGSLTPYTPSQSMTGKPTVSPETGERTPITTPSMITYLPWVYPPIILVSKKPD